MKTIVKMLVLMLLILPVARGQNPVVAGIAPVLEAGLGYSYVDASVPSQSRLAMNGADLVGTADFSRRLGINLDLGYARSFDAFSSGHTADILTYLAGPVFYPVRTRNMNVYAHLLLGGARETGVNFENNGQIVRGYASEFAWAGGAGFQHRISRSFAVRLGADYLRTSFFNEAVQVQSHPNIRGSISLIYTLGEGRE